MARKQWLPFTVDNDNNVLIEGETLCEDSYFIWADKLVNLRRTPNSGLHVVVSHSATGIYLYKVNITKPGQYFMGPTHGYRKIPPEEEMCPLKKLLRKHGVSVQLMEYVDKDAPIMVSRTAFDTTHLPGGSRVVCYSTDGDDQPAGPKSLGLQRVIVNGFNYVFSYKQEMIVIDDPNTDDGEPAVVTRTWFNKLFIKDDEDVDLEEATLILQEMLVENQKCKELMYG